MTSPDPTGRRLRPGVAVLTRDNGVLQVGLEDGRRVLLPDLRAVRRLLDRLTHGPAVAATSETSATSAAAVPGGAAGSVDRALARLQAAGLLVADDDLGGVEPALLARHGDAARLRSDARASARVHLDVAARLLPVVQRLVAAAGLVVTAEPTRADVALVVADRVLDRARLDPWVREGVPHLCVEARDGGLVVGPLVAPGATACLRCVDAHRGEDDPVRPLLLERLAARPDPAPYDEVGVTLALAWAVRDLRALVEGERPSTWSATLEVDTADGPVDLVPRAWARHPCCGCGWDVRATG